MANTLMRSVILITTAGSGVLGGVFFGFTTVVMPALGRLPAVEGLRAMQAINVAAPRSLLMVPLVVSAIGSLVVGGWAALADRSEGQWLLVAAAAPGVAAFVVTAAYHVPRNDALGLLDPASADAVAAWAAYQPGWTALNSVRAALALVSGALMVAGLIRTG